MIIGDSLGCVVIEDGFALHCDHLMIDHGCLLPGSSIVLLGSEYRVRYRLKARIATTVVEFLVLCWNCWAYCVVAQGTMWSCVGGSPQVSNKCPGDPHVQW